MMEKFTGSSSISLLEIVLLDELLLEVVEGTREVVELLEIIDVEGSSLEDGLAEELAGF